MTIRELGYVVFESPNLDTWRWFGQEILGMAAADGPDGALYLKMDDRDYRFAIIPSDQERYLGAGWGVESKTSFDHFRETLTQSGIATTSAGDAARDLRRVQDAFWFNDPAGNRHEVYWGAVSDFRPFISPIGVPGFVTDTLGLGHVVLPAMEIEEAFGFASEKMRFGLSDILSMNFAGRQVKLYFMHCDNNRQHSMALARMPASNGLVHMMVELPSLKDVGMALDRVLKNNLQLVMTLGQHVNDDCVSFYFLSPTGYMIEIGWQGILKDWSRHSVFETTLPSYWGHQFVLGDPRYQPKS